MEDGSFELAQATPVRNRHRSRPADHGNPGIAGLVKRPRSFSSRCIRAIRAPATVERRGHPRARRHPPSPPPRRGTARIAFARQHFLIDRLYRSPVNHGAREIPDSVKRSRSLSPRGPFQTPQSPSGTPPTTRRRLFVRQPAGARKQPARSKPQQIKAQNAKGPAVTSARPSFTARSVTGLEWLPERSARPTGSRPRMERAQTRLAWRTPRFLARIWPERREWGATRDMPFHRTKTVAAIREISHLASRVTPDFQSSRSVCSRTESPLSGPGSMVMEREEATTPHCVVASLYLWTRARPGG